MSILFVIEVMKKSFEILYILCYNGKRCLMLTIMEDIMKHIKTINDKVLKDTMKKGGCGECQTSCQSACKTSCTVGNQSCENKNN